MTFLRRLFSSNAIKNVPRCVFGWQVADTRTKSGWTVANALLDGNYRTSWDHFDVHVRQALVSSLAYLKEGSLPPGLMLPLSRDGHFLNAYVRDTISASRADLDRLVRNSKELPVNEPVMTVFDRHYDIVCPLPSSKGPASPSNMRIAQTIVEAFSALPAKENAPATAPPQLLPLLVRRQPMLVKSANLSTEERRRIDAPRLIHYDTMTVDMAVSEGGKHIRGKNILLYDDNITWGNISEAGRNLLLLMGASEVDLLTCFAREPVCRAVCYELEGSSAEVDLAHMLAHPEMFTVSRDSFALQSSTLVSKELLRWRCTQESLKSWHANCSAYIERRFPEFEPNDIPW